MRRFKICGSLRASMWVERLKSIFWIWSQRSDLLELMRWCGTGLGRLRVELTGLSSTVEITLRTGWTENTRA
jgi:hypothetical protein